MPSSTYSAKSMNALNGTFIGLATTMAALRFYARRRQKAPLLADDWLILPALAAFLGCAAVLIYDVHIKALGYSSADFSGSASAKNTYTSQQMSVVLDALTVVCLGCVKCSACMFYRRIFCPGDRRDKLNIAILTTVGLVTVWTVTYTVLSGLQCGAHLEDVIREPALDSKYCISFPFYYSLAITDLIFDIWVLLLPVPRVLRLKTTPAKKASVLGVFLLACGGLAAGITRAVIFVQVYFGGVKGLVAGNFEQKSTKNQFFMILEAGLAFVAVNMPSVWMVITTYGPEGVQRSFRRVTLFASNHFKGSRRSSHPANVSKYASQGAKGPPSSSSLSSTLPFLETQGETFCMADMRGKDALNAPPGQVIVKTSHWQTISSQNQDYQEV